MYANSNSEMSEMICSGLSSKLKSSILFENSPPSLKDISDLQFIKYLKLIKINNDLVYVSIRCAS